MVKKKKKTNTLERSSSYFEKVKKLIHFHQDQEAGKHSQRLDRSGRPRKCLVVGTLSWLFGTEEEEACTLTAGLKKVEN